MGDTQYVDKISQAELGTVFGIDERQVNRVIGQGGLPRLDSDTATGIPSRQSRWCRCGVCTLALSWWHGRWMSGG